ncbi:unnamed protein product [Brassica rapa subsp. narinosa]
MKLEEETKKEKKQKHRRFYSCAIPLIQKIEALKMEIESTQKTIRKEALSFCLCLKPENEILEEKKRMSSNR